MSTYMRETHLDQLIDYLRAEGIPHRVPTRKKGNIVVLFNRQAPKDRDTDHAIIRSAGGRLVTKGLAQTYVHRFYTARLRG